MVSKDKNPLKNKKIIILVILVLIAGALAFYQFSYKKNHNKVATTSEPEKKINYDPPTQSDKDLVNSNKDSIVKKDETIKVTKEKLRRNLSLFGVASASRCHSWIRWVAENRPIEETTGVRSGLTI